MAKQIDIKGIQKLHPAVRWAFRISMYTMTIFLLFFFSLSLLSFSRSSGFQLYLFVPAVVVLAIVIGEVFVRLTYNNWKYEFVKEGLKIERGVIWKTYKSIPYERIQNVDIRRGIMARIFGFSTVDIQTAGYSGFYSGRGGMAAMSEGHLPGVSIERAEEIREMIMKKIGRRSGL